MHSYGMLTSSFGTPVKNIDLRLLAIVSELHRTRSVSQTAENLELSQSAVSMCLAKLRRHFKDPLFVRTSAGMEPTPHAVNLIELLQRAEGLLQSALDHHVVFDPLTSERHFNIYSTDIAQVTLMPKLMKRLAATGPGMQVDLRRISEITPKLLESGEADLAIGFVPEMGAGFCQQRLFRERFVCAVHRDHPRVRNSLSLDQFQEETHLGIATSGTGHSIVEQTLQAKGIRRKVGLTVPSFLGIASIITNLDYIATLPEQLARHLATAGHIKVLTLPVPIPPYYIMQHWHERFTNDPATRWLRATIADLFCSSRADLNPAKRLPPGVVDSTVALHHQV
jgi:DNA-binding transcriptional LysR family regulator